MFVFIIVSVCTIKQLHYPHHGHKFGGLTVRIVQLLASLRRAK